MAEYPAMPLWTDSYLGDTIHLTTIEHGCYLMLLMTMWRAGGSLPNDDKLLARYSRLTPRQWQRIKPIIFPFFRVEDDTIFQPRLRDEINAVRQRSKVQSDNARAKYRKSLGTPPATAQPKGPIGSPSIPIPIKEERTNVLSKKKPSTRGSRLPEDWEVSQGLILWAIDRGISDNVIAEQTERFKDWWPAQPGQKGVKVDWDLTWKNWMRKSHDEGKRTPTTQRANDIESYKRKACTVLDEVIAHNEAVNAAGSGAGDIGPDEGTRQRRLAKTAD